MGAWNVDDFEESNATSGSTLKIYNDLKTWEGQRGLKGVHFGDKTIRPLQAADLVTREAFKYFKNRGTIKARIPVDRMRDVLNFCVWGRDALEYLRDYGGPEDVGSYFHVLGEMGRAWQARATTTFVALERLLGFGRRLSFLESCADSINRSW